MKLDILIIGGGIAGLWILSRLRQAGYNAWLVENNQIGGIQSIASQGIIHGGTKYALGGKLGDSAKAIGDMPAIWNACLNGQGEIDLSNVDVHTTTQLMWSTQSVASKVAGFFADKLMQSRMQKLNANQLPAPFDSEDFHGDVYQLNEPVLNTASLMSAFYEQIGQYCLAGEVNINTDDRRSVEIKHPQQNDLKLNLKANQLILAAGEGNEKILVQSGASAPLMQRRPVHMVMLKSHSMPLLYAHCLGAGSTPRLTITSTQHETDRYWYIGGGISETGVARNRDEQIKACKQELQAVLPWLNFDDCEWSTLMLDRAEILTPGNKRPDSSFVETDNQVMTVWPTKLAFAPKVAATVMEKLSMLNISPSKTSDEIPQALINWPKPGLAQWPWLNTTWQPCCG